MINFSDPHTRYLIDYANIKQGLIKHQSDFLSKKEFNLFLKNSHLGCPLVLPFGIKYFNYSNIKEEFYISKKKVTHKIFSTKKKNYIGVKIFFKFGRKFCTGATLKKKYLPLLNSIIKSNKSLISLIKKYKYKKKVASFQTRNIPHLGHELIIQRLFHNNKIVCINPLIGLKKKGDCRNNVLEIIFKYLARLKMYKSRVFYKPLISNMNYAGPREALHHAYVREKIGFDFFAVGRDHAGAENIYPPLNSTNFIKKNRKRLKIKIFFHKGAYFCDKCKKILLRGDCKHKSLNEISGTEFRKKIMTKTNFIHASSNLQNYLKKIKTKLFY